MRLNNVSKLTLLVIALACVAVAFLLRSSVSKKPDEVAESFVHALMRADLEDARSMAVAAQHERLDEWVETATPFACSAPFFREAGFSWGAFSCRFSSEEENSRHTCTVIYDCKKQGRSFTVRNIEVDFTEQGWRIYDWGEIEAKDS